MSTAVIEAPTNKVINYKVKESAPTVYQFQRDYSFITAIVGPFGSSKSVGCVFKIIHLTEKHQTPDDDGIKRVRWAIIRNTYQQLKDTTIKTVLDWLPENIFGTYNKTDHIYRITGINGIEIELLFRALDRPDQVGNLLSLEITGAWINEFREVPKEIFDAIQGRVGRYPAKRKGGCPWFGVIMDSNAYDEGSYYHEYFEKDCPDNARLYRQPSGRSAQAENIDNLPANYYTNLAKGKDKEYIKVYIDGLNGYIQEGDPITPEYQAEIHRSTDVLKPYPGVRGIRFWDAGHNPTCIIGQLHPVTGRLIIYDTYVGEHMGMLQLVRAFIKPAVNDKYSGITEWFDTGDPACVTRDQSNTDMSPANVIAQELRTRFVPGVSDWDTRKQAIKYVLTNQPMLLLSKNEVRLHQALRGGWAFKKLTDGKIVKDAAIKNIHSHPADALSQGLPRIVSCKPAQPPIVPKKKKHWLEG